MSKTDNNAAKYYSRLGSRLGYRFVMKRSQHFGYYDSDTTSETIAQDNYHKKFTKMLDIKPGMRILDAGCGQGVVACYLAREVGANVTGITITPREVISATIRADQMQLRDKTLFLLADYSDIPKAVGKFDRIYTTESLSHAIDVQLVIRNFEKILKPGGKIICAVYEMDHERFDTETKRNAGYVKDYAAINGMYQFGPGQFESYLKKVGLTDVKVVDWTKNMKPSFDRLRRLASPLSYVVRKLGVEKYFVNTIAAKLYSDGVDNKVFAYKVYTAEKPQR